MKKGSNIIGRMMTSVMLNCDKATFLISKHEIEKLKCIERVKLNMHLLSCNACRRFLIQTKYITNHINAIRDIDPNNLVVKLSDEQKDRLNDSINLGLNKN